MRQIFAIFTLLFTVSCAHENVRNKNILNLIKEVRITGEAKCRLTLYEKQNLFSCESLVNNSSWFLSYLIPFQGEGIIEFPQINRKEISKRLMIDSHNLINEHLEKSGATNKISSKSLMQALHTTIRFLNVLSVISTKACYQDKIGLKCSFDDQEFLIKNFSTGLHISSTNQNLNLQILAEHLGENGFSKTSIFIHQEKNSERSDTILSLEFFWKS